MSKKEGPKSLTDCLDGVLPICHAQLTQAGKRSSEIKDIPAPSCNDQNTAYFFLKACVNTQDRIVLELALG